METTAYALPKQVKTLPRKTLVDTYILIPELQDQVIGASSTDTDLHQKLHQYFQEEATQKDRIEQWNKVVDEKKKGLYA